MKTREIFEYVAYQAAKMENLIRENRDLIRKLDSLQTASYDKGFAAGVISANNKFNETEPQLPVEEAIKFIKGETL